MRATDLLQVLLLTKTAAPRFIGNPGTDYAAAQPQHISGPGSSYSDQDRSAFYQSGWNSYFKRKGITAQNVGQQAPSVQRAFNRYQSVPGAQQAAKGLQQVGTAFKNTVAPIAKPIYNAVNKVPGLPTAISAAASLNPVTGMYKTLGSLAGRATNYLADPNNYQGNFNPTIDRSIAENQPSIRNWTTGRVTTSAAPTTKLHTPNTIAASVTPDVPGKKSSI